MTGFEWAIMLRPLGAFLFLALIVAPIKITLLRLIPEGYVKRILLISWRT